MMKITNIALLMVVVSCGFAVGCTKDPNAKYPVSGMVRVNGEPVATGAISFLPVDGTKVETSSASSIVHGKYDIPKKDGLLPGEYKVQIYGQVQAKNPDGTPKVRESGKPVTMDIIPDRYNMNSTETVTIEPGKNKFDYGFDVDPSEFKEHPF